MSLQRERIAVKVLQSDRESILKLTILIGIFFLLFFKVASAQEIKYDSGNRRNPFLPLVTSEGNILDTVKQVGEYKIEGIIYDPHGGSFALINGKFYKEGERVDNAQVISILKDRVILSANDAQKVIWLREEIVGKK